MLTPRRKQILVAGAIAAVFIAFALVACFTVRPRADEGFFASPALNLIETGSMGTPVIEPGHLFMKDIDRYTYWITPLDFLAQAAWYKVFGFGLIPMRLLSMVWGLAALGAWFVIVKRMAGCAWLALFAVALVGLDYNFITGAASGRMDMMAAALGFGAFAVYLQLRERNLTAAVVISNALVCAAGLTHPVAGYLYFAGLLFLTLYYDRKRLRLATIAAGAVPYLVGAAGWGSYILKDPEAFRLQFATNASMHGRLTGLTAPWIGLVREVTYRYFTSFGLGPHSLRDEGPVYLKGLILAAFAIGLAGAVLTRDIRKNRDWRALMLVAAIFFTLLGVFDGQKAYYYLIHIFPFYAVLTAVWLSRAWQKTAWLRPGLAIAVAGLLGLQLGASWVRSTRDTYARTYEPAIEFLKSQVPPNRTIMGSASLGFGLNFPHNLVDDVRLGYYTGRKPDYVVINREYFQVFLDYRHNEPEIYDFIVHRLTHEYERVYDHAGYQVYAARPLEQSAAMR